jgi:Cu+-exporting ATPase
MDVMYSFAMSIAMVSSILGSVKVLDENFIFYDTALILASFLLLGRYLETRAKGRISQAIRRLMALQPKKAMIIHDGKEIEVSADELSAGDIIVVRSGERIPIDGEVVEGQSWVDESMLTGDNERSARSIAKAIGIDNVIAGVIPEGKAKEMRRLQQSARVAFVGDGINDASALAQADVGIAMGGGTDIAIESGDTVLMHDDPGDVYIALELTKKIMRRIKENIFWAFAYNTILIPLAAGVFYPYTITPKLAALAMALSSVTVVSLSLSLKGWKPNKIRGDEGKNLQPQLCL